MAKPTSNGWVAPARPGYQDLSRRDYELSVCRGTNWKPHWPAPVVAGYGLPVRRLLIDEPRDHPHRATPSLRVVGDQVDPKAESQTMATLTSLHSRCRRRLPVRRNVAVNASGGGTRIHASTSTHCRWQRPARQRFVVRDDWTMSDVVSLRRVAGGTRTIGSVFRRARSYEVFDPTGGSRVVTLPQLDLLLDARAWPDDFWNCVDAADQAFSAGDRDVLIEWPTARRCDRA
jgi:hypothetical protein